MVSKLEDYRNAHSTYPIGCDPTTFATQVWLGAPSPSEKPRFYYCSDGQQYLLALVPFGRGEYGPVGAPVVAANNDFIAWPVGGHNLIGNVHKNTATP